MAPSRPARLGDAASEAIQPADAPALGATVDDERNSGGAAPNVDRQVANPARQPLWMVQYRIGLLTLDLSCIIIATITGQLLRFGVLADENATRAYLVIGGLLVAGWTVALQYVGGYEIKHLATGPEEAKRVLRASAITASVLAIYCYATRTEIARGYVVGVIPIGVVLLLIGRTVARRMVQRFRASGSWTQRILAVGTTESVLELRLVTERAKGAGLTIVGACVNDAAPGVEIAPGVPVIGGVLEAAASADAVQADVVAVTGSGLGSSAVRELGWELEGTGRGLVIAPALTEIAGPRVHVSPVEGLPLVWLEQPQLGRLPKLMKRLFDLVFGSILLLLAAPVLIGSALAVKLTSRGPVFFRQQRLGVGAAEFSILKFRSMYDGAAAQRAAILHQNEQDGGGVLFKIRRDPRVTPIGRIIRRLSIDELPQLVHVVTGQMSLVGPRPLAADDSGYTGSALRRLLVRPGLTGLWQVSGRSILSWDDAVRLDLYYVENWSLSLDLTILARTVAAVLGGKGAF